MNDLLNSIYALPGGENLSRDFCNKPVSVSTTWLDEAVAAVILLCGRLVPHEGDCDPIPLVSDFM